MFAQAVGGRIMVEAHEFPVARDAGQAGRLDVGQRSRGTPSATNMFRLSGHRPTRECATENRILPTTETGILPPRNCRRQGSAGLSIARQAQSKVATALMSMGGTTRRILMPNPRSPASALMSWAESQGVLRQNCADNRMDLAPGPAARIMLDAAGRSRLACIDDLRPSFAGPDSQEPQKVEPILGNPDKNRFVPQPGIWTARCLATSRHLRLHGRIRIVRLPIREAGRPWVVKTAYRPKGSPTKQWAGNDMWRVETPACRSPE